MVGRGDQSHSRKVWRRVASSGREGECEGLVQHRTRCDSQSKRYFCGGRCSWTRDKGGVSVFRYLREVLASGECCSKQRKGGVPDGAIESFRVTISVPFFGIYSGSTKWAVERDVLQCKVSRPDD